MKFTILLLLFILVSCNDEKFKYPEMTRGSLRISSASISSGRLTLTGTSLNLITEISPVSGNLSGYTMTIESRTPRSLTIKLTHATNSALALALGTVLTFTVSTASAQTTVNLTIEAAVPSGTVVAYDGVTCPTGWSDYTDGNGRVIVGSGTGNLDKDGVALSARTLNDAGGREVASISLPASSLLGNTDVITTTNVLAVTNSGGRSVPSFRSEVDVDTSLGSGDNDNMPPFIVLKYCKKD